MKLWMAACAALVIALLGRPAAAGTAASATDSLDLQAYRGKVVYLDFWASWCTPCRRSFPWLDSLVEQYGRHNFVVIGVNVDRNRDLADKFLKETPAEFPIVYDPKGKLASQYMIVGMPSAVLIDRTGKVRFQHTGFTEEKEDEYESHVQTLLSEAAH